MNFADLARKLLRERKDIDINLLEQLLHQIEENKEKKALALLEKLLSLKADPLMISSGLSYYLNTKGKEENQLLEDIKNLEDLERKQKQEWNAEAKQNLFLLAVQDPRSLILFAVLRLIDLQEEIKQEKKKDQAKQARELYAPLVYRIGLQHLKSELEDEAFKILEPEQYKELEEKLKEKRESFERRKQKITRQLYTLLEHDGRTIKIKGRIKHLYGLYQKILKKETTFEGIHDFIGIRIIVESLEESYHVMNQIHAKWNHLSERFKDYIITPKQNGYRSLHTVILDDEKKIVEIQIRTEEMDEQAEKGMAAHWLYKGASQGKSFDKKLNWLKELKESEERSEALSIDLFAEKIMAFTPKGKSIELPKRSSCIDFAYTIHSSIGNHCVAAFINGSFKSSKTELQNGDIVEIVTDKNHTHSSSLLHHVKTVKARSHIRQQIRLKGKIPFTITKEQLESEEESILSLVHIKGKEKNKLMIALCCKPKPGDLICAVEVSQFKAKIHKNDCVQIKTLKKKEEASWVRLKDFTAEIVVEAEERVGIYAETINTIVRLNLQMKKSKGNLKGEQHAEFVFEIHFASLEYLKELLERLEKIKGIKKTYVRNWTQ